MTICATSKKREKSLATSYTMTKEERDLVFARAYSRGRHSVRAWDNSGVRMGLGTPSVNWMHGRGRHPNSHAPPPDSTRYPLTGFYQEVVEPERLVFSSGAIDGDATLGFRC
jgi:hypothetical protein